MVKNGEKILNGYKSYYIDAIITYANSLISMNNLYCRHLLPSSTPIHADTHSIAPTLSGNKLVLFTMFTDMLKQRDKFHHEIPCKPSDADWLKSILVLGKPGTGETFTIHQCIDYCRKNNTSVCLTLACTYREKFDDTVHCDTVHSLLLYRQNCEQENQFNYMLSLYDVIFIDEMSQISTDIFHHIIQSVQKVQYIHMFTLHGTGMV